MPAHPSSTRSTTRPRPGRCCTTTGSKTTPASAWWFIPPVGKQLIAIGEAIFGYNGRGLAVHRRAAWRRHGGAGDADRPADQPLDPGRRDRRGAADLRRRQLCRRADRAARRVSDLLRGRGVRRAHRRPRSGAPSGCTSRWWRAAPPTPTWGPRLGRALVALPGAGSCSDWLARTKWSGLYFVLFFGAMSLAFDVAARRQYQVTQAVAGGVATRPVPHRICVGAHPVRGLPGQLCAVVRVRDRDRPARGGSDDRSRIRLSRCPTRSARCGTTPPRPSSSTPA